MKYLVKAQRKAVLKSLRRRVKITLQNINWEEDILPTSKYNYRA